MISVLIQKNEAMKHKSDNHRSYRLIIAHSVWCAFCIAILGIQAAFAGGSEPRKPERLTVRAWPGPWREALHIGVSKPFTKRHGIEIAYDTRDDKDVFEDIERAFEQERRPPTDVNWDTTVTAMRAALAGYARPLSEKAVPNLTALSPVAKPQLGGDWPFVSVYTYTAVLAYRTDMVAKPPSTWKIFLEKRWKKSVGMYKNGYGFHPVAAILSGGRIPGNMEPVWDFYEKLKPNIGLLGWDDELTGALIKGTTPLQCSIISNVLEAKRKGAPVAWVVPREGALLERDAMWIPRNLPPETIWWGMKYIDFALSREAQEVWCGRLGVPPVNTQAKFSDHMKYDPAFFTSGDKFKKMIVIPTKIMAENRPKWFEKFREIMK